MSGLLTRQLADVEIQMNSVERSAPSLLFSEWTAGLNRTLVGRYMDTELFSSEEDAVQRTKVPSATWPEGGSITMKDVSVKYSPESADVLKKVSLEMRSGEKLAIVGRTGAGKSTLVNSIMRVVEYAGSITVDGYVFAKIGEDSLTNLVAAWISRQFH